ncbi:9843_t:CDS:2 [Ambispora leptoticha]|uniref:9843_t:CDS:1 n=1 Tax=Ambispora leptoticha TaxID=144679 RepID=A0A9N8WEQ3_9GLOM|nr:9843_t:CDS:2 [Ambispora leptoticha]
MNFTFSRRTEQAQRRKSIALRGQSVLVNEKSPIECLKEPIFQLASSIETLQKKFRGIANTGTPKKSPFKSPRKSPFKFKSPRKIPAKTQLTPSPVNKHFQFPTSLIKNIKSPESTPIPTPTKMPPPTLAPLNIKKKPNLIPIKNFIKRVIDGLPLKYREQQPHRKNVEDLLRQLFVNPKGLKFEEIMQQSKLKRVRCNEYLVALVHAKEVIKENITGSGQNGQIFKINPIKYPLL